MPFWYTIVNIHVHPPGTRQDVASTVCTSESDRDLLLQAVLLSAKLDASLPDAGHRKINRDLLAQLTKVDEEERAGPKSVYRVQLEALTSLMLRERGAFALRGTVQDDISKIKGRPPFDVTSWLDLPSSLWKMPWRMTLQEERSRGKSKKISTKLERNPWPLCRRKRRRMMNLFLLLRCQYLTQPSQKLGKTAGRKATALAPVTIQRARAIQQSPKRPPAPAKLPGEAPRKSFSHISERRPLRQAEERDAGSAD